MRAARIADFKRRIRERAESWPLKLTRLAFLDVPGLGTTELALTSPFTVVSGPNGVGKTTVLRALWSVADNALAQPLPGSSIKLTSGSVTLDFEWKGAASRSEVSFVAGQPTGGVQFPVPVVHIDASEEPRRHQRDFCTFDSLDDLLNGVSGSAVNNKSVQMLSFICRRDYKEITLYEVEGDNGVLPFFEVAVDSERYDSRTMGAGEITALYIWWAVERAEANSLILIEEPETFLSPTCQESLCLYILSATVEKQLVTVLTSHSAKIVNSIADGSRLFLYKGAGGVKHAANPVSPAMLNTVGIEAVVNTICMVEDEAARMFLESLIELFDPSLRRSAEIVESNGDGDIIAVLKRLGGCTKALKIIGMFDGDLVGKLPGEPTTKYSGFLPSDQPVEKLWKALLADRAAEIAEKSNLPRLEEAIFALQGQDHHDWFAALSLELGLTKDRLFSLLFQFWIELDGNEHAARVAWEAFVAVRAGRGGNARSEGAAEPPIEPIVAPVPPSDLQQNPPAGVFAQQPD